MKPSKRKLILIYGAGPWGGKHTEIDNVVEVDPHDDSLGPTDWMHPRPIGNVDFKIPCCGPVK